MSINRLSGKQSVHQTALYRPELKHGQIIRGKVSKLFPNDMAQVRLQNHTLMAKLEIPLMIGDQYHFQVQITNHILYLKVIGNKLKNNPKSDITALMRSLGIKKNDVNRRFLQQLISEEIPFDRSQLIKAIHLLGKHKKVDRVEDVLKDMMKRQLPLTDSLFQAMHTMDTSKQSELIDDLLNVLRRQNSFPELASLLKEISEPSTIQSALKEQFLQHIQRFLTYSGLDYEYQVLQQGKFLPSIKGYLLQMLSNNGANLPVAEKLLHFINGMQLNAVHDSENFIYVNLHIPGEKFGFKEDIHIEFNSRKKQKNKIDPDYCRIHFYLELPNLKETLIDMNIQQRNVTLTIYNNMQGLKKQTEDLQKNLKSGLEKINYNLSTIAFKSIEQFKGSTPSHHKERNSITSQGVDYRI